MKIFKSPIHPLPPFECFLLDFRYFTLHLHILRICTSLPLVPILTKIQFSHFLSIQKTSFAQNCQSSLTHMPKPHMPQSSSLWNWFWSWNSNCTYNHATFNVERPLIFFHFIIIREPFEIFKTPSVALYMHPFE